MFHCAIGPYPIGHLDNTTLDKVTPGSWIGPLPDWAAEQNTITTVTIGQLGIIVYGQYMDNITRSKYVNTK